MEIKPFIAPETSLWDGFNNGVIITVLIISGLAIITAIILDRRLKGNEMFPVWAPMFIGIVGIAGAIAAASGGSIQIVNTAYKNHVSELQDSLTKDGFKILSGNPDLHTDAQSSILLSYGGNNFDCTVFSPKDVNTNVVFSCGETKLSLTQIKES